MNRLNKFISGFCFCVAVSLLVSICEASSLSVTSSATSLTVGSSATIRITGNDAIGKVSISSSNPSVIAISSSSEWVEGSVSIKATAVAAGTATISVSGTDMANSNGDSVAPSGSVKITAKTVVAAAVDTRSSNANLTSLNIENFEISPAFSKEVTSYTASVSNEITQVKVSAIPEDTKSTTVVSGNMDLVVGQNNLTITVTAENGTKKVYNVVIDRKKSPEDINALLKSLTINNATLKNTFDINTFEYLCDNITSDINALDILAETQIEGATYQIEGNENLKSGINHVKIIVKSRDGSETKEYIITVFKSDEALSLKEDINTDSNSNIKTILKENWLTIVLSSVIVFEFIVIIYLYKKKNKSGNNLNDKNNEVKAVDIPLDEENKENSDLEYTPIIDSEKVNEGEDNTESTLDDEDEIKDSEDTDEYFDDGDGLDIDYTFDSLKALESLKRDNEVLNFNSSAEDVKVEDEKKSENDTEIEEDKKEEPEVKEEKSIFKRRSGFDRKR